MTYLEWLPLVVLISAIGGGVGVLLAGVVTRPILDATDRFDPRFKHGVAFGLAALPAILGIAFVAICFIPSTLDVFGLVADHCLHHVHVGHSFHLCYLHGVAPEPTLPIVVACVPFLILIRAMHLEAKGWARGRAWVSRMKSVARYDEKFKAWFVSVDGVAFTSGFLSPDIFLSDIATTELSKTSHAAVLEHERAHARRRDALLKSIARVLGSLHFSTVRQQLIQRMDESAEEACDFAAARVIGDKFAVADAIVYMSRTAPKSAGVSMFGSGDVESRIRALVDDDVRTEVPTTPVIVLTAALILTFSLSYEWCHHTAESFLAFLI